MHFPLAFQDTSASFLAEFISTAANRPRTNTLDVTIAEVATEFIQWSRGEYRQSNEATVFKCALRPFVMVHGRDRITEFGSSKLLDLQQYRVAEGSLTRPGINKCLNWIRQFFKWAAVREPVSGAMRFRAWTRAWQISQERRMFRESHGPVPRGRRSSRSHLLFSRKLRPQRLGTHRKTIKCLACEFLPRIA